MSSSNLFFTNRFSPLTAKQIQSLSERCMESSIKDLSCTSEDLNTCGKSISELLSEYPLYESQRGLFTSWGDVDFTWGEIEDGRVGELSDDAWSVAEFVRSIVYSSGEKILLIEEDGYRLSVYEASQDITYPPGPFDPTKWEKICSAKSNSPAGLPSPSELLSNYPIYSLEFFEDTWGGVDSQWGYDVDLDILEACRELYSELDSEGIDKCVKAGSSSKWKEARKRREFFYKAGDIVLVEGECGDTLCVWQANEDIPATEEIFISEHVFVPNSKWSRVYCVSTGENKCLDPVRSRTPESAYELIPIGSNGHFVEMPIKSKQFKEPLTLNKKAERIIESSTLSPREIYDLDHSEYKYTQECE